MSIDETERRGKQNDRIVCRNIFRLNSFEHDYLWMNNISIREDNVWVEDEKTENLEDKLYLLHVWQRATSTVLLLILECG